MAGYSQLTIHGIDNHESNSRILQKQDTIYTLDLPFWDDFSTAKNTPDTLLWATGDDVFVNATLGKNPPTYNVATFDGLRSNGSAHNIESEFSGASDSLVSHYIDLSKVPNANRNSVYLSFYWQAQGNGELPDDNDSLVVQFYADSVWVTQWVQLGGEESVSEQFDQVVLPVDGIEYFHEQFRFKFVSYSSLKGPFDTWHIDYVYLNQNRTRTDRSHFDRSLSGSASLLFSPYYEMPADHFFLDPLRYLSNQQVMATNLDGATAVGHPLDYYYQLQNLTTDEVYNFTPMGNGGLGGLDPLEFRTIEGPSPDSFTVPINNLDSQVIASTFYYRTNDKRLFEEVNGQDTVFLPVDLKVNDTITTQYTLHNYYAYDDGTAEFAVAVNQRNSQVAIRFLLGEEDTLTHVDIYFPNIAPSATGESMDIMVWNRLDDSQVLAKKSHTVERPGGINEFTRIELNQPVLTKDTVYVGYQQLADQYLGIGFDRNNHLASEEIYTNVGDGWTQNTRLSGAIMIRPVFGYDSSFVLHTPKLPAEKVQVYPNPSRGLIHLDKQVDQIVIQDMAGRELFRSAHRETYDLSFLKDGIYLLRINNKNNVHTQKLIIQK